MPDGLRIEEEVGAEQARSLLRELTEFDEELRQTQRSIEGRDPPATLPFRASSIVGRSAAIRNLVKILRQIAPASLPVLVTGETGTGKASSLGITLRALYVRFKRLSIRPRDLRA